MAKFNYKISYLPENHPCFTFFGTIINITDRNILLFVEADDKQHSELDSEP